MPKGFAPGTKRPPFSEEWLANMSKAQMGKKLTAEHKEKIGAYWRGKPRPETRKDFCKRGHDMNLPGSRHPKQGHCMECKRITDKRHRDTAEFKAKKSKYNNVYNRKRFYGLSELEFARMFVEQNGVCAICKEKDTNDRQLSVDHDHQTGKIRALLCFSCNITLGKVKDSVALLEAMIQYLKEHGQMSVVNANG
jgi:Recombination endonuclease VII